MSFGGELPKRREYMWGQNHKQELRAHFDILSRAINNAKSDAEVEDNGYVLDHLDHIETEIGRLKTCLDV